MKPETSDKPNRDRPNGAGFFRYVNPTTIHYGVGCLQRLDEILQAGGTRRAHIVTTRSLLHSNAMDLLRDSSEHLRWAEVSVISAHVPIEELHAIAHRVRNNRADAIIALGGGSPIDAAKLVSLAAVSDTDDGTIAVFKEVLRSGQTSEEPPAVFCIPTTLSAAELEGGAGWTDDETLEKDGVLHPALTPHAVLYDPRVAAETPRWLWLASGVRALDHAVETLLGSPANPIATALSIDALLDLFNFLPRYAENPGCESTRLACQLAAWKSYTAPHQAARGFSHVLGRTVGARNRIPHGIASCVILPQVVRFYERTAPYKERIPELTDALKMRGARAETSSLADELETLVSDLGLPTRFSRSQLSATGQREAALRSSEQLSIAFDEVNLVLESCIA